MKPRILFLISKFHPLIGGAEKQAQRQASELIRRGYSVIVLTGRHNKEWKNFEILDNILIHRYNYLNLLFLKGFTTMSSVMLTLFFLRKQYDLIHLHMLTHNAYVACIIGKLFNKPVIAKIGSSGSTSDIAYLYKFLFGKFLKLINAKRFIFKNIDCIICLSDYSEKELLSHGFLKEKIRIIPNGVSSLYLEDFNKVERIPSEIVSVGRLSYEKGYDILMNAMQRINYNYGCKFNIIGDGPEMEKIRGLIHSNNLENTVILHSFVSHVHTYLLRASIFVLPSRHEGMSNALLEAMLYGLACIVTKVGGNAELIAPELAENTKIPTGTFIIGSAGILVNKEDATGLAMAIKYLMEHTDQVSRLGIAARQRVLSTYTIDKVIDKYETLYNDFVN